MHEREQAEDGEHGPSDQQALAEQLRQAQEQLIQSEKMASIGQLAAGVAHEINNPIGYIRSNLSTLGEYCRSLLAVTQVMTEALGDRMNSPELLKLRQDHDLDYIHEDLPSLLEESHEGIQRVESIIRSLKDFSRTDTGEREWIDIHQCLDKTLTVARNEIKYCADISRDYGDVSPIHAVESQIGQVFLNLLVNAAQAIQEHGEIRIATWSEDNWAVIQISDTGSGIAPEHLKQLFDPFFTTKPVGKGTGLGLSISYGIIQNHQGEITVESEPGKGTTFNIRLPTWETKSED